MEKLPIRIAFRRVAAYSIDILGLFLLLVPWQVGVALLTGGALFNRLRSGLQIEAWILCTISLPIWLYFIFSEASAHQTTLGKRWLRLKVEGPGNGPISKGRAVLRTAVKLLPWELSHVSLMLPAPLFWSSNPQEFRAGLLVANGLIVLYLAIMFFDPRRRSMDDLVAGTQVIERV